MVEYMFLRVKGSVYWVEYFVVTDTWRFIRIVNFSIAYSLESSRNFYLQNASWAAWLCGLPAAAPAATITDWACSATGAVRAF